ncbi:MAG TPA: hypothetical protein VG844_14715 [Terracidiphilus sp.]|nr:hypothetical protein [Terracidiphilus sp.]
MAKVFPWKRFWCRREDMYSLSDGGFLSDPDGEHGKLLNPHLVSFDQLQAIPCLALLGEPGVGKSWTLSADLDAFLKQSPELAAMRLDLRGYGSEDRLYRALFEDNRFLQWIEGDYDLHLYLDSFDECLLRIDNVSGLLADELPKRPLNRLKLRIACRTVSWPPLLENALAGGFGKADFAAVELVPLRRVDVLQAAALSEIAEPAVFLERIDNLGISSLASKPITLRMLLDTFRRDGNLPSSVLELYEKGCTILCEEQNESRRASHRIGRQSPRGRVAVASRIAAVTQFGNRFAIWIGTEAQGVPPEDVAIAELTGNDEPAEESIRVTQDVVLEALGTGLFSSRGQEQLGWSHQTLAEYLAARYCITHQLPIQQIRSLIFHPRRHRVIPQVREVASWLALQSKELFTEIAENEPSILLGSPSASLSIDQRQILTDALLRSCDQSEVLHIQHKLELRHLAHPALAEQLKPVIIDRTRSWTTRYFAIRIIRDCAIDSLGQQLLAIALSDEELHELRTIAAYAIADVGSEAERNQMRPLLVAGRQIDPNDQLRGATLNALYPGDKYDDEMWDYIEHPRQSLFFGSYNNFLSYSVVPKLNASNLPAALRWCARQPVEDLGPIPELEGEICRLAVENIDADEVAGLLAQTIFERCKSYRGFPNRGHKEQPLAEILANDEGRRRRFLESFLPLLTPTNEHLIIHPLSVLRSSDLDWFIDRVVSGTSPVPHVEAKIVSRLACSWEAETVKKVWDACRVSPTLAAECNALFEPVPLDSELAKWERRSREDVLKENNIQVAPALLPRCEAALESIENGKVDGWLQLISEMSVDEGGTRYMAPRQMNVEKLPGWLQASDEMRSRIVGAAKTYLTSTTFPTIIQFPSNQIMNGASAGVNALALLQIMDPGYLEAQPADFWMRWVSSLIEDGRAREDKEAAIEAAFRCAAKAAPLEMNARLLEQIRFENSEPQKYLFCAEMLDRAWSETLGITLLDEVRKNGLTPSNQGIILYKLVQHGVLGAKQWAEETVHAEYKTDRGLALAQTLVNASGDASWDVLWPLVQGDTQFGRDLLEGVSYGSPEKGSFTERFSDGQLGELYSWLLEQYPPGDDRLASGAVGPVDTIRFLRDGTLERLKQRGTFEACDALAKTELQFPEYRWLGYHFDLAEILACSVTWEPPTPRDILAIAADHSKRFVESGEQLLSVVLESLTRLQQELHGELAAVGDLWNSQGTDWWPKQEEDVSDYIARFLRRDLLDRGLIINREVQIRRGRRGEMRGQSTDIHVDASPRDVSQADHYGTISVIIEVKGSWNAGLMTDMEDQLRDRYMKNNSCRIGIYVVAHFVAERWIATDDRRAKSGAHNIDELRKQLADQARGLSGSVLIRSFVIDASLDSTNASVGGEQVR